MKKPTQEEQNAMIETIKKAAIDMAEAAGLDGVVMAFIRAKDEGDNLVLESRSVVAGKMPGYVYIEALKQIALDIANQMREKTKAENTPDPLGELVKALGVKINAYEPGDTEETEAKPTGTIH